MINVGDNLPNGATVFAVLHAGSAGSLVMAKYEEGLHPWVVWRIDKNNNCEWGNYFHTPEQAQDKFLKRAEHLMNLAGFYYTSLGV